MTLYTQDSTIRMPLEAFKEELLSKVDETVLEEFNLETVEFGFIEKYTSNEGKNAYTDINVAFERAECDTDCFGITYNIKKKTYSLRKSKKITKYTQKIIDNAKILEISILKNDLINAKIIKKKERCNICGKERIITKSVVDIRKNFKDRTKQDKPYKTLIKFCKKCEEERITHFEEIAKEEIEPDLAVPLEENEVKALNIEEELILQPKKIMIKKKKKKPSKE